MNTAGPIQPTGKPQTGVKYQQPIEPAPDPVVVPDVQRGDPKDPQPDLPDIWNRPAKFGVEVHPERYDVGYGETWSILPEEDTIEPLKFPFGSKPALLPLLNVDGLVVEVEGKFLVSPQTLADIQNSSNPHYDIAENGKVLTTSIGLSVPIIKIDVASLRDMGAQLERQNARAGIRSVEYIWESPTVYGVPESIIEHINWVLNPDAPHPADRFELWRLKLEGDYSITNLKTYPLTTDGKLDYVKIRELNNLVFDRMDGFHADLNTIKSVYFGAALPIKKRNGWTPYEQVATMQGGKVETTGYIIKTVTPGGTTGPRLANATVKDLSAGGKSDMNMLDPITGLPIGDSAINASGDETLSVVNRWRSYGFTPAEVVDIRNAARAGGSPVIKVGDGSLIGLGGVMFGPALNEKARIILPMGNFDDPMWMEYYGTGLSLDEYSNANQLRIAELLNLSNRITALELKDGKSYQ